MILFDTGIITLWLLGHARLAERVLGTTELVAITVVTRVELLRGRFDSLLKASDGVQLQQAQWRSDRANWPSWWSSRSAGARRRVRPAPPDPKIEEGWPADLLIAAIALAHRATLVTRNVRDFQQISMTGWKSPAWGSCLRESPWPTSSGTTPPASATR